MKFQVALIAAAAALAIAAPAAASEGRVEARAGMSFGAHQSEEFISGVAVGYDFDLSEGVFFGLEASADKLFVDNSGAVLGATARLGMLSGKNRYYATGGYTDLTCNGCGDAAHLGAGADIGLTDNLYGKVEYRHFFLDGVDSNVVAVGAGVRF